MRTKGGRIQPGSVGGNPRDEKKPRNEDKELEHGEGEPLEKGSEAGPSRRRNTPVRPQVEVESTNTDSACALTPPKA